IENVYLGRYKRTDGKALTSPSVSDVVRAKAPAADADVRKALAHTVARMQAIVDRASRGEAFDQLIAEGNTDGNRIVQDGAAALRRAVAALDLKGLTVVESEKLRDAGATPKRN